MSKKSDLKKQIIESEAEIEDLERKRMRSQSAIMESQINGVAPNALDLEYFKVYSQLIDVERKNLRRLNEELDNL